jgi:hypothetical protein
MCRDAVPVDPAVRRRGAARRRRTARNRPEIKGLRGLILDLSTQKKESYGIKLTEG